MQVPILVVNAQAGFQDFVAWLFVRVKSVAVPSQSLLTKPLISFKFPQNPG